MLYTTDAQRVIHLFKWCCWVIDDDHCSRGKLLLCLLVLVLLALQCLWCRRYVGSLMIFSAGFLDLASYGSWRGVDYSKFIFSNLHHSPMDPLQWMGAIRTRVQTADKNTKIIHTTGVKQKICMFVKNKFIVEMFLISNSCFWLKYDSSFCLLWTHMGRSTSFKSKCFTDEFISYKHTAFRFTRH